MGLENKSSSSNAKGSLGNKFREKRFNFFKDHFEKMDKPVRIIDLGGTEKYWIARGFHERDDVEITLVNLSAHKTSYPHFKSVAGDATNLIQYKDGEFDIAFSNSVIEHLYTYENQVKMAKEVVRVGKFHFLQTPNKYFFVEPHYLLPYFQFIPRGLGFSILTKTKLSRKQKWTAEFANQYLDEIRLISHSEMKVLFPSSDIYYEKFYMMNKSFTAHNFV